MKEVVIVSATRTAVGSFGGALKDHSPIDLGAAVALEAISRAGIEAEAIDHSFFGNVLHTEPRDMYLARAIARHAGVPDRAPALTMNRLCGSGLQAIVSALQAMSHGDGDVALVGGAESMSRSGHLLPAMRWGQRIGDTKVIDMMLGVLTDPFGFGHMGVTAENVASRHNVSRTRQDSLALESHRRASSAIRSGHFKEQITPITLNSKGRESVFDTDEHVRHDLQEGDLSELRTIFKKDGTVTPGNSSGINDGAAALVLMTAEKAQDLDAKPFATIRSYALAGVDPAIMGIGPFPAMQMALKRAGLSVEDLDVIESNEAFAAQACAVSDLLNLPSERVNPNGGAIALGHPLGATGAILMTKLIYELRRIGGRFGAVTMCIGGGQGIAMVIENASWSGQSGTGKSR